jgi:hypothetical protein
MPWTTYEQHKATGAYITTIPTSNLEWSLLCVALMVPISETIDVLDSPRGNKLDLTVDELPKWKGSWLRYIPFVGGVSALITIIREYTTDLEDVADFLAQDLKTGSEVYFGKNVGMKRKEADKEPTAS